jgi:hypothetical protein
MTLSNIGVTQGADAKILVDNIGTTGYPISKMILGEEGVNGGLVSTGNPVPMTLQGNEFYSHRSNEVPNGNIYNIQVTEDGELATTSTERQRNTYLHLELLNVPVSVQYIQVVDLSDTGNYNHSSTGRIDFSTISVQIHIVDPAGAIGDLSLGVVTDVSTTGSDITWGARMIFDKKSDSDIVRDFNYSPSQLKFGVENNATTRIQSNNISRNISEVNSTGYISSSIGSGIPDIGDIVVKVEITQNTASFILGGMYHSEPFV